MPRFPLPPSGAPDPSSLHAGLWPRRQRRRGAAGGPSLDLTIPNLKLWLRADAGVYADTGGATPAAGGGAVALWKDQSASHFDVSQAAGANQAVYLADSGFNGRPGVQVSGGQYLSNAAAGLTVSQAAATLIAAWRQDNRTPVGAVFSTTQDQMALLLAGSSTWHVDLNSAAGQRGVFTLQSTAGGQVTSSVFDGSQAGNAARLRCWRNRAELALTYNGTIPATTFAGGTDLYVGRTAGGSGGSFTVLEVLYYSRALTTAERQSVENYLAAKYFAKSTSGVGSAGDSITAGNPFNLDNPYPLRVATALGWAGYLNRGSAGMTAAGMVNDGGNLDAGRDDWYAHQPATFMGGINDLGTNHVSAATLEGSIGQWVSERRAARWPVFISTILPASTCTGADETTRLAVNAWILAGSSGADYVVDCAGDPRLSAYGATYYEGDQVHPNSAGHQVLADLFVAAMRAAGY